MLLIDNILPAVDDAYRVDKNLVQRFEIYANYATWLAALALTGWAAGYSTFRERRPRVNTLSTGVPVWPAVRVAGLPATRWVTVGLLGLFVVLAGSHYLSGRAATEALETVAGTLSGPAAYVHVLLKTAVFGLISAEYFSLIARKRAGETITLADFGRATGFIIAIIFSLVFVIAGERGEMIQVLVLFAILHGMNFRPVPWWEFIGAIAIGSLLFTILGHTRAYGWGEIDAFLANFNIWRATVNLANSALSLFLAIEVVEMRGAFYWGQLFTSNILAVVPYANSFVTSTFGISSVDLNSAYLFAVHIYGPNPHTGPGTSITADVYANVGPVGTVVVMFLFGVVCHAMTSVLRSASALPAFAAAAAFASLSFYVGRSSLFVQLQPAVWAFAFAYVFLRLRPVRPRRMTLPASGVAKPRCPLQ